MGEAIEKDQDRFVRETNSAYTSALLDRFEKVTGHKPHRYLRRGIVFCHRDLEVILDKHEQGLPFYLLTGRGPSSENLHLGHSIPFEFTKWLQQVFDVPLIIMLTDDMKMLHQKDLTVSEVRRYDTDNAKDILAFGFDPTRTFLFSNLDFVGGAFYENIISVARHILVRDVKASLGFTDDDNVGKLFCCSTQSAGTFATSFPGILGSDQDALRDMHCLVACSYDIDGYFSEVRKHARTIGYQRPAFLYSSLLSALQGAHVKMSASIPASAIFLSDDAATISGKLETALPVDEAAGPAVAETIFQYLRFAMEDDAEFGEMERAFEAGELSLAALRGRLVDVVRAQILNFQVRRSEVTDESLKHYMTPRLLM